MTNARNAIEVDQVSKSFGDLVAVDNVSFDVADGEIFGFLGPNGAGKTTLTRILTTLVTPTGGAARVGGYDVVHQPDAVRRKIGVVPQAMTSDLDLTGFENMDIYGRFYSIPRHERRGRIRQLLAKVGLETRANDLVATYSGGMRRRLEIARVLVHRPDILFLDEPTIGLDPQSRRVVWEFLQDLRKEDAMTILLTTHYLEEPEALCQRVAIIDAGKIVVIGSPAELKMQIPGNDIVTLGVEQSPDTLESDLQQLAFVHKTSRDDGAIRVSVDNGARNLPAVLDAARNAGARVTSVVLQEQSLEDVFIHYTGKAIRDEDAKKPSMFVGPGVPQKFGR